jgi:pyrroline-5-carboxylate reductase
MGSALLGGLIAGGHLDASACVVVESSAAARAQVSASFPGVVVRETCVPCASAVLAVKPANVEEACAVLNGSGVRRVLSILAGTTIGRLESLLPDGVAVIRAMPNTPALLGAGATAIASGSQATEADFEWAESLLATVGLVVRQQERSLDAVTGLSGSGPAYLFMVAEALIDAGERVGLDPAIASSLAIQTILGAARMLAESGQSPAELREQVTSPGGTTAAGLAVLERFEVRAAFFEAVAAATARSAELGRSI